MMAAIDSAVMLRLPGCSMHAKSVPTPSLMQSQRSTRSRLNRAGVTIEGGESLAADLVIDASGRRSKIDDWLRDGGYEAPRTVTINPNIGYQSTLFDAPQEVRSLRAASRHRLSGMNCIKPGYRGLARVRFTNVWVPGCAVCSPVGATCVQKLLLQCSCIMVARF